MGTACTPRRDLAASLALIMLIALSASACDAEPAALDPDGRILDDDGGLDGGLDAAPDGGPPGDGDGGPPDGGGTPGIARLADVVVDAPGASGTGYGDPTRAANGVRGGGASNGSLDVYSLDFQVGVHDTLTLGWSDDGAVRNGPGDDLAVFENPFNTAQGPFMDLMIVEVSRDGTTWRALAHDYATADETAYVRDVVAWHGFAGRSPVFLHAETNPVDPFDRVAAGGDGFDLDDVVGDDAEAVAIRASGIRYVRLVTAPSRINPDTGAAYVRDEFANGADIDGVWARYVE